MRVVIITLLLQIFKDYSTDGKKIRMDVYYESFCPESRGFVTKQLDPVFSGGAMQNDFDIYLNPYGKAAFWQPKRTRNQTTGLYDFSCQHGIKECAGNFVHICLFEALWGTGSMGSVAIDHKFIPVVACLMKEGHKAGDPTDPLLALKVKGKIII